MQWTKRWSQSLSSEIRHHARVGDVSKPAPMRVPTNANNQETKR